MERIKVLLPPSFAFSTIIPLRITDLNYGNHVGNHIFLSLAHEARLQFLKFHGYTELNVEGAGLIMADAALEYKQEITYPANIRVSVAANNFDKIGFDILYLIEVSAGNSWMPAAKIKTGMVCFDYTTKKRRPVPEAAIAKFTFQYQ